jgi:hypothetical protein
MAARNHVRGAARFVAVSGFIDASRLSRRREKC